MLIFFIIGMIIGVAIMLIISGISPVKIDGDLKIDTSRTPDDPYIYLLLNHDVHKIQNNKYVVLKIVNTQK